MVVPYRSATCQMVSPSSASTVLPSSSNVIFSVISNLWPNLCRSSCVSLWRRIDRAHFRRAPRIRVYCPGQTQGVMTMTVPTTIAHAVQQTQEWLKELRDNGGLASEAEAYAVLRAVLHQLRDRLTLAEAVDLGQQLP